MEKSKSITIILLLTVGLLTSATPAKTVSVLLQEGLYAEEIEGDLDTAIKIYEQVISESKEAQRSAAQATYRIGMCYLKKGEKTKAAAQFSNLVSRFPGQKPLIAKAQRQLAKLKPPAAGFGPVIERVINQPGSGKECMIDFESGKLFTVPEDLKDLCREDRRMMTWLQERGIDAIAAMNGKLGGLEGFRGLISISMKNLGWDASPNKVVATIEREIALHPVPDRAYMFAVGGIPFDFFFKTGVGSIGVLQLLEVHSPHTGTRIRYKMLQGETAQFSVSSHKVFLPECDTTVYDLLDLASNKMINSEPGGELLDLSKPDGKGNLYFDRSRGSDYLACVRGTRMQLRSGGELLSPDPNFISHGRNAYYPLVEIPCQYLVTTAQGDKYELKVLSVMSSDRPSIEIEYWKSAEAALAMLPEKVKPSAMSFGPVMERVINDDGEDEHCLIDFDTGRLFSHPTEIRSNEVILRWFAENQIDAMGETSTSGPGLYGFDMASIPIATERWETISPEDLADDLSITKGGTPAYMSAVGDLPKAYTFKTREGGMGVVQILEMQPNKKPRHFRIRYKMLQEPVKIATVEVFGPVIKRLIDSDETDGEIFFDLDTAQAYSFPPGLTRASPPKENIEWSRTKGIDFANDRGRLELVDMTAVKMKSGMWKSATPREIRDALQKGVTQDFLPSHSKDYTITSPFTYAFETREGGIGILQILEKKNQNLRIRYKMIEDVRKIEYEQQLAESARKLKQLGLTVAMFANEHNSKLPDNLQELEHYIGKKQDFQWILYNVEYTGKGKKVVRSQSVATVIAYDKTLLEEGNGTNVLFCDSHVEFKVPGRLEEIGITPKTPRATFDSKRR